MLIHLNLRSQLVVTEHDWVDTEVVGTSSILRTGDAIDAAEIFVGDPLKWLALPVEPEKRIFSSFDDCVIPFYESMFKRIGLYFPFFEFEVYVLKYLIVIPS